MGIGRLVGRLGRLWLVVAVGFVILLTAGAYVALPTPYQSQVQLAMTAPTTGNPYLTFNSALDADVDLLSRSLTSQASAQQLQALGVSSKSYTASIPVNALGPFIELTVTGSNKAQVVKSMQTLITYTEQRWRALQVASSAPSDAMINLSLIAPASTPAASLKRKLEEVIGVAIVAIVIALLVGALVDGATRRRTGGIKPPDSPLPERSRSPQVARTP